MPHSLLDEVHVENSDGTRLHVGVWNTNKSKFSEFMTMKTEVIMLSETLMPPDTAHIQIARRHVIAQPRPGCV